MKGNLLQWLLPVTVKSYSQAARLPEMVAIPGQVLSLYIRTDESSPNTNTASQRQQQHPAMDGCDKCWPPYFKERVRMDAWELLMATFKHGGFGAISFLL